MVFIFTIRDRTHSTGSRAAYFEEKERENHSTYALNRVENTV
jgi:hypothetical protein